MTSLIPPGPPLSRDDGRLNVERRLGQRQVSTVEFKVEGVSTVIELLSAHISGCILIIVNLIKIAAKSIQT